MYAFPQTGFVRLSQIIGDKRKNPPTPGVFPVCASTWWSGVKKGIYPSPVKLSSNVTAWRAEQIRELIDSFKSEAA
jgi:prophage regulatory protein